MAELVGRGNFAKSLKAAFDLRARSSYRLADDVAPVASLLDLDGPPFHTKSGFAHFEQVNAGGAGTFAWMVLTLQAGDTGIGVLRRIEAGAGSASSFYVTPLVIGDLPALGANLTIEDWDVRGVNPSSYRVSRAQLKTGTPAVAAISRRLGLITWPAGGMGSLTGPWVFTADHWIALVATVANTAIQATLYGDVYDS